MKKIIYLIFITLILMLFFTCTNFPKKVIPNGEITKIILNYPGKDILNKLFDNENNLSDDELWNAYLDTHAYVNIDEEYWDIIRKTINKAEFSHGVWLFGPRYSMVEPWYSISIEFKHRKNINITVWGQTFYTDRFYKVTNESKYIHEIIKEIIQ